MLTDHKPLTHSLNAKPDRHSPRQVRQLDFISQFTSDIRRIAGKGNPVADGLSRLGTDSAQMNAITPTIDFTAMAKTKPSETDLQDSHLPDTTIKFARVVLPVCTDTLLCDNSTGTPRPYVPDNLDIQCLMHYTACPIQVSEPHNAC